MTIRTLLYYPTMSVPKQWAKTALLNGYSIGSVVPDNWNEYSGEFLTEASFNKIVVNQMPNSFLTNSEMKYLKENNLYKPFNVNDYRNLPDKTYHELEKIIDYSSLQFKEKAIHFLSNPDEKKHQSWLLKDKTTKQIIDFLVEKKLADPQEYIDNHNIHYIIEDTVANIYVSLYVDNITRENKFLLSSSDQFNNWQTFANPSYSERKKLCMNLFLKDCIISPKPDIPLEKIIHFLDEHKDQTRRYNENLVLLSNKIAKSAEANDLPDIVEDEILKIRMEVDQMKDSFDDLRIKYEIKTGLFIIPILFLGLLQSDPFRIAESVIAVTSNYYAYYSKKRENEKNPWTLIYELSKNNII